MVQIDNTFLTSTTEVTYCQRVFSMYHRNIPDYQQNNSGRQLPVVPNVLNSQVPYYTAP